MKESMSHIVPEWQQSLIQRMRTPSGTKVSSAWDSFETLWGIHQARNRDKIPYKSKSAFWYYVTVEVSHAQSMVIHWIQLNLPISQRRATSAKAKSSSISKADSVNLPLVSGVTNAWLKPPWPGQLKKWKNLRHCMTCLCKNLSFMSTLSTLCIDLQF